MESSATFVAKSEMVIPRLSPISLQERVAAVDVLRGLALLGILIENMAPYAGFSYDPGSGAALTLRTVVGVAVMFFLEAKSYTAFALLLGWGAAAQARRASSRGVRFAPFYLRRIAVLLVFGLAHAILIWFGDILVLYALMSLVLLLLYAGLQRFAPQKVDGAILAVSLCALILPAVLALPGETMDALRNGYEDLTSVLRYNTFPESLYATGSYGQTLGRRIQDLSRHWSWFLYYVGAVLSVILVGFYLGKRQILSQAEGRAARLRKMAWIGFGTGVPLNALYVITSLGLEDVLGRYHGLVRIGSRSVGAPALVLALLAFLSLRLRNRA